MAAVDAIGSGTGAGVTSITFSHTCTGTDLGLKVGVSFYRNGSSAISSVTYNAVAMTAVPGGAVNNGNYFVADYTLINPDTGTHNVVVTFAGPPPFDIGAGSISFTGVHQTTLIGTPAVLTGFGAVPSVAVSSAAGEIVTDTLLIVHGGTLSVGAGQTSRWNAIATSGYIKYAGSTEPGASTTTMSWTNQFNQDWALIAVPIKPVSPGAGSTIPVIRHHMAQQGIS